MNSLLIYSPIKIDVKSHKSDNYPFLEINGSDAKGTAFVKFKLDDIILESHVVEDIYEGYKIEPEGDWNNYEIEIYNENTLIYKAKHNIIRSIELNMDITSNIIEKRYLTINEDLLITHNTPQHPILISDNNYIDCLDKYLSNEKIEKNKIKNPKESYCTFLKETERAKAFKLLEKIVKENGELWIFDPFFISANNGVDVLIDILMILCNNQNTNNKRIGLLINTNNKSKCTDKNF